MPILIPSPGETWESEKAKKENTMAWTTVPVHGNSKRLCEIRRSGEACGTRASHVSTAADTRKRNRLTRQGYLPIFHCDHPRHVANAHKQITELLKD